MNLTRRAVFLLTFLGLSFPLHAMSDAVLYSAGDVKRFLKRNGYDDTYTYAIRRNAAGTQLYFYQWPQDGSAVLAVSADNEITKLVRPARHAFLADNLTFVAWTKDNDQVAFRDGSAIAVNNGFDVDYSGRYFVANTPSGIHIAAVNSPEKVLVKTDLAVGVRIFSSGDRIYLFGVKQKSETRGPIFCQVFHEEGRSWSLEREIAIPKAGTILDFDPNTHEVLLVERRDLFPSTYKFNLLNNQLFRIGWGGRHGFFLQRDLLKAKGSE